MPEGAPKSWNQPFLNMAVAGDASLAPESLLAELKTIEKDLGRQSRGHWAPREIDIDILAMGDMVISSAALSIPHPHLLARDFALVPLAELVPDWCYPAGEYKGWKAADIVAAKAFAPGTDFREKGRLTDAAA